MCLLVIMPQKDGVRAFNGASLMPQVPWEDLRYIFGEIMYGGHIVEDWDRRLASAYLLKYFQESLSDGLTLFPGFATPPTNLSYVQVRSALVLLSKSVPSRVGLRSV